MPHAQLACKAVSGLQAVGHGCVALQGLAGPAAHCLLGLALS